MTEVAALPFSAASDGGAGGFMIGRPIVEDAGRALVTPGEDPLFLGITPDKASEPDPEEDPEKTIAGPLPKPAPGTITLLTADDYKPFVDRSLDNGGLTAELVASAMDSLPGDVAHDTFWINDWSSHLSPLLSHGMFDAGFPWIRPDCANDVENIRCREFLFSEPMFEFLVLLFTRADFPMVFEEDDDMLGRTLCRPSGYFTHDLEGGGRNWVSDGKITLVQPASVNECFKLLEEGAVDAVAINEFTGRVAVRTLGIDDQVTVLEQTPLSIETLHVVVHKDHPEAEVLIRRIDAGFAAIREDGTHRRIVDRHLTAFWDAL